ncbi:hypothetical protein [Nocardioides abyssi]|uniref:Uncharacterized protein n=1 Tax=Nocardioides abyssi TaxID=3058370 RepID=A0ABT8EXN6_9ACTN|nr:hypothetical protein [Nocardioides abyssi]MDN4162952.1 hypothetical protein [Nocardioides abyssi]
MEVTDYVPGTNHLLDAMMDGEAVKIVQGMYGRTPIIANTDEEAADRYVEKYRNRIKQDEEDEPVTDEG